VPGGQCATCGVHAGQCVSRSQDCINEPLQITCGCDGKLYRSPCQADLAGVDPATDGGCETPPGTFRCGTLFCTHGTQYCQTWYSTNPPGSVSAPWIYSFSCADLAAGCPTTPTCDCVTATECGDCSVSADGDLTAMCRVVM